MDYCTEHMHFTDFNTNVIYEESYMNVHDIFLNIIIQQHRAIPIRHVELIWRCVTLEHAEQKK